MLHKNKSTQHIVTELGCIRTVYSPEENLTSHAVFTVVYLDTAHAAVCVCVNSEVVGKFWKGSNDLCRTGLRHTLKYETVVPLKTSDKGHM